MVWPRNLESAGNLIIHAGELSSTNRAAKLLFQDQPPGLVHSRAADRPKPTAKAPLKVSAVVLQAGKSHELSAASIHREYMLNCIGGGRSLARLGRDGLQYRIAGRFFSGSIAR